MDDKGEQRPACPARWGLDDWLLTNGSGSPASFQKHDCVPWRGGAAFRPAVNASLGNNTVKLSFDRLTLAPGESAKISVCINPEIEAPHGKRVMFSREGDLTVFFDGAGRPAGVRRWPGDGWRDAAAAFALGRGERTLTFKTS